MNKRKKRSLTLLEVVVAVSVTGMLLTALWTIYQNWYKSYEKTRELQARVQKILFLKQRLERLFLSVSKPGGEQGIFTPADGNSFCLVYEGEPDPEPLFNDTLRSLLHLNEKGFLCLTTWNPSMERRTEILLDRVDTLKIDFFDAPTASWRADWPAELDLLPRFVRITLQTLGGKEELIFQASRSLEPIVFLRAMQEEGDT